MFLGYFFSYGTFYTIFIFSKSKLYYTFYCDKNYTKIIGNVGTVQIVSIVF